MNNHQSKVLITGGAGFIGQRLARRLLKEGHQVRILDNFSPQIHSSEHLDADLVKSVELIKADVRDKDLLKLALKDITSVVHLAAETGTGQSMYEIDRYFSVNVQGTAGLLDLLQNDETAKHVRSLIVASSRAVYGEGAYQCDSDGVVFPEQRKYDQMSKGHFELTCPKCQGTLKIITTPEDAPFHPMSFYGLTKQVQEQAVLLYGRTHNINTFALRYQNVYGPGQSLKNPYTGILAVFSNLARQNQGIEIYEDGNESRDFVYIDDVVEATAKCVEFSGEYIGALNIGSGKQTTVMNVAEGVKEHFKSDSSISVTGAFRVGDIRHNIANIDLAAQVLEFSPQVGFEEGLKNFLDWVGGQPAEDKFAYLKSVNELASKGLMGKASSN
jgi:dTDP-L-rhamnose 4-epimerase